MPECPEDRKRDGGGGRCSGERGREGGEGVVRERGKGEV